MRPAMAAAVLVALAGCGGGQDGLAGLVSRNGDTSAALGVTLADFHRDWFAFARQRYNF